MRLICPKCKTENEFSLFSRDAMKASCKKCRKPILTNYKKVETWLFALAIVLLIFVFTTSDFFKIAAAVVGFIALEYPAKYVYVLLHNAANKK